MSPTHERLLEALHYDPETGVFRNLITRGRALIGDVSGWTQDGYCVITLDGYRRSSHVWAWFYMTGNWPTFEIDHIDGITDNNRFANLRDIPHQLNLRNEVAPRSNNTSGYLGVSWHRCAGRWAANIRFDGILKYLGLFDSAEEAHTAYMAAKELYHGLETYQGRLGSLSREGS